jgi:hypothetical protein
MTLRQFFNELMVARNTDLATIASILQTQESLLKAVIANKLRPIPSVWEDRLIEAFYLNDEEQKVWKATFKAASQQAVSSVRRTFTQDEK